MMGCCTSSEGKVSLTLARAMGSVPGAPAPGSPPSRDGGDDGDVIAGLEHRLVALEEADVLLVDIEVDEAAHLAALVHEALLEPGELLLQALDQAGDGVGLAFDLGLALRQRAQRRGDADEHGHGLSPSGRLSRRPLI